jgi:hypothetical protein
MRYGGHGRRSYDSSCVELCFYDLGLTLTASHAQDLDLGARVQPVPVTAKFSDPAWHIWCGAPARGDDGKYHLFYSRWPAKYGFAPAWAIHSEIAYAVSESPFGPFRHVSVILPPRGTNPVTGRKYWDADVTHNPNIVRRGAQWLLYYTGNYGDGVYATHRNHQRIGGGNRRPAGGPVASAGCAGD